jgi:hypothetical protein
MFPARAVHYFIITRSDGPFLTRTNPGFLSEIICGGDREEEEMRQGSEKKKR